MSENDNLKRLNEISSAVSERDMKIWENVAHSVCIKKQTETLKNEIKRMKAATSQKKKENKMIEEQLVELTKTLAIQRETLKASEKSVVMQKAFKESLSQEANDFRKKYSETLNMYNDELQAYRSVYENASQGYKELKSLKISLKKLEIKNMLLDANIFSVEKSQQLHKKIQEEIFHKTMVRFAEFYNIYHKREKIKMQLQEKKKEEQHLLKEHLQLAEALKQKKRMQMNKVKVVNSVLKEESSSSQNAEAAKEKTEMISDKFQKFLNEEISPCSLTLISRADRLKKFNPDNSKVKILDVKMVRPLPPRPLPIRKPNTDLRKKMESIMQTAKQEARRSNSFQLSRLDSQSQGRSVGESKTVTPSGSQSSQTGQRQSQHRSVKSQGSQRQSQASGTEIRPNPTPSGSQEAKKVEGGPNGSQKMEVDESSKSLKMTVQKEANSLPLEAVPTKPREIVTSSILKRSQEKNDKQENVSKFFNPKKKTVTFQNEAKKEIAQEGNRFQLFTQEDKKAESGMIVKNMDIFQKPFFFKNEAQKQNEINRKDVIGAMPEEVGTSEATGTNISFTMESGPTTFGTFGSGTDEKKKEMTFDLLETSFSRGFGQSSANPSENFAPPLENTTFNFFGSQNKSNPFSFSNFSL